LVTAIKNPILLACVFAVASSSQNGPAFRPDVELVAIPCTVVGARGVPVDDLTRDEFRVYDNGIQRIVEHLWRDTDEPLTLGIIIDVSESQQEQRAEHRQTALELLARILRHGDRAFVISVDEDVRLWVDLTATTAEIRKQMAETPRRFVWTALPETPGQRIRFQAGVRVRFKPAVECDLRRGPPQTAPTYRKQSSGDSHRWIR
jgi:VWFA-related protein